MTLILYILVSLSLGSFGVVIGVNSLFFLLIMMNTLTIIFSNYYLDSDIISNFNIIISIFIFLIIVFLTFLSLFLFLGWEGIGLMSLLLISYWYRPNAISSASSAIWYNRFGDLFFLLVIYNLGSVINLFIILAVLCKSSIYVISYWLPVAMESPTPVSAMLHSSTMVVAGVIVAIIISCYLLLLPIFVILISVMVFHYDVNKNIAYSTSLHLLMIFLYVSSAIYSYVVVYVCLHSLIKGVVFQGSGYEIHGIGAQDIRVINYSYFGALTFLILMGFGGVLFVIGKENLILVFAFVGLILVVYSLWYSFSYISNYVGNYLLIELKPIVLYVVATISMVGIDIGILDIVGIVFNVTIMIPILMLVLPIL